MADQTRTKTGDNELSRKRSRDFSSSSGRLTAQRRDKYTTVACNECRKRKIKCTGGIPCRRCENYTLHCAYTHNDDPGVQSTAKLKILSLENDVQQLRAQVDKLSTDFQQMRQAWQPLPTAPGSGQDQVKESSHNPYYNAPRLTAPTQPQFIGPTSSAYNFNVANNTLKMMGIQPQGSNITSNVETAIPSRNNSPELLGPSEFPATDLLLSMEIEEIYSLLEIYREELDPVYPFIALDETVISVPLIYEHLQQRHMSSPIGRADSRCCGVNSQDVKVLKLMVSSALVLKNHGESNFAHRLVESVDNGLSTGIRGVEVDLQGLRIFTLMSIYYFHCDEPVLAWRTIGFAARIALEIGLHRSKSLEQKCPDAQARLWAIKLFWCIYILDRRWSFGTGMPFALQDSDIDPDLPRLHDTEPYLDCMIDYGKICSRVWSAVAGFGSKAVDKDAVGYLDFQIQQWLQSIPPYLQLLHPCIGDSTINQPRGLQRLRVLLYIRGNHMRSFVHRHNVLSASNIAQNLAGARLVTDIAKDTITVLVHLRETSTVYDTQQSAFNYFLVSAISAIFLAVCHAPVEFSDSCRDKFQSALTLLNDLSTHSHITRRLWKSVRGLKNIAPQLGLAASKSGNSGPRMAKNTVNGLLTAAPQHDVPLSNNFCSAEMPTRPLSTQGMHLTDNYVISSSESFDRTPAGMLSTSEVSPSAMPNIFQIGNDLTQYFEAFGHHVDNPQPSTITPNWTMEEVKSLQNGVEVSRLFEGLL